MNDNPKPRATIQFILPVSEGMVTLHDGTQMSESMLSSELAKIPDVFTTKSRDGSLVVIVQGVENVWSFFPKPGVS